jgi:LPXTG-site transpeptidase (sortase) family protein
LLSAPYVVKKVSFVVASTLVVLTGLALLLNADYVITQIRYVVVGPEVSRVPVTDVSLSEKITNRVFVPRLGIDVPLVYATETREQAFQKALESGVVHFPGTALPGQLGNVYIFGHSSDYPWAKGDYKTAFALLPKIVLDDEIIVNDEVGTAFRYRVVKTLVVKPDELWVLDQPVDRKLLTLQTSYPIGTALRRYIVQAELITE